MVKTVRGVVRGIKEWTPEVRSLYIEADIDYVPGQYILLQADIEDKRVSRAYSLASIPEDEYLEVCYRKVGLFTNYLHTLRPNSEIDVIGPFGHMTIEKVRSDKVVFIATGTGITPFRSMIREMDRRGDLEKRKTVLIQGAKYREDLIYYEEFKALEERWEDFKYVPVTSRQKDWPGIRGHVQDALPEYIWTDADYFICGLPAMTDDVERILRGKGVANIYMERF